MKDNKKSYNSFEEFKLMYESAEKVTDRRLALNRFNYSICTAIFLAIGFLWNWSLTHAKYDYAGIFMIMVLSIIAAFFTSYWIRMIKDYKLLNNAKFDVINEMSDMLFFTSEENNGGVKSYEPFKKEWDILQKKSALQENKRFKIIALKSSNLEYFIPKAFRVIFIAVSLIALIAICMNLNGFVDSLKGIIMLK